jgi:hypothetical protein
MDISDMNESQKVVNDAIESHLRYYDMYASKRLFSDPNDIGLTDFSVLTKKEISERMLIVAAGMVKNTPITYYGNVSYDKIPFEDATRRDIAKWIQDALTVELGDYTDEPIMIREIRSDVKNEAGTIVFSFVSNKYGETTIEELGGLDFISDSLGFQVHIPSMW